MKKSLPLIIILGIALFLRIFRTADLMGFYYDQGRDGLIIWDLVHHGKIFLIGPTTGIEGIFLGPFYYYLIAPFYALGQGNPVFPAVELALINVLAIAVLYYIGSCYFNKTVGLLAAILVSFSANLISAHRWLSNPTPLPLFALLAVLAILKIIHGFPRWWPVLGLSIGLALQLEAASAIFFLPATFFILAVNRYQIKSHLRFLIFSLFLFVSTLLPQIIFNFRHANILVNSFLRFLISEKSFKPVPVNFLLDRLAYYYNSFFHTLTSDFVTSVTIALLMLVLLVKLRANLNTRTTRSLFIWWLTPLLFLLFYHGNHGYVWGYYFTGVYPIFILLVSIFIFYAYQKYFLIRPVLVIIALILVYQNINTIKSDIFRSGPALISLTTSTQAIDWVYQKSLGQDFNLDVYVPPVIPYAYDYLALWRGTNKYNHLPSTTMTKLLFTLYEPDFDRPEALENWLVRQDSYGPVTAKSSFGLISAQVRTRL